MGRDIAEAVGISTNTTSAVPQNSLIGGAQNDNALSPIHQNLCSSYVHIRQNFILTLMFSTVRFR